MVGMRNYQKLKENPMKDLGQSHKDATKLKNFMVNELDWEPASMITDSQAQELNVNTAIRKQLDEIATKLKTLTMELDIAVIAVIHTNRQGQIRGTAGVEQLANIVVRLERDKIDPSEWRRNITKITVEKNRFCGYTGPACYLWYNKDTARLTELDREEAETYENGGSIGDDEGF